MAVSPDDERLEVLWESLYLTRPEIAEFLLYVRRHGTLPWVYPMMAFAAYTGRAAARCCGR